MEMQERDSGILVPREKPQPSRPGRVYGPLELQDEDQRAKAMAALGDLWDAMDLSEGGSDIRFLPGSPGRDAYAAHWQAYEFVGKMLLGDDCPEKEVLT